MASPKFHVVNSVQMDCSDCVIMCFLTITKYTLDFVHELHRGHICYISVVGTCNVCLMRVL